MKVTKERFLEGIKHYSRQEIIPNLPDQSLKMMLSLGLGVVDAKPEVLDGVLDSSIIKDVGGMYDLEFIETVLKNVINEFGDLTIVVPSVKFISPGDKVLKFHLTDVAKFMEFFRD